MKLKAVEYRELSRISREQSIIVGASAELDEGDHMGVVLGVLEEWVSKQIKLRIEAAAAHEEDE